MNENERGIPDGGRRWRVRSRMDCEGWKVERSICEEWMVNDGGWMDGAPVRMEDG